MTNAITPVRKEKYNPDLGRLSIAFFYDDFGIVDEYFFYLLQEMSKFTTRDVFVSNGPIRDEDRKRLVDMGYEIIIRDNVGFDVWAYKTAIEYVGYENLHKYSEVMLYNHTFYGPIYPFEEMFSAMEARECGFWGITAHKELDPNPFADEGVLPWHLNSHFIAVRNGMASSAEFREYWQTMPMITSYNNSVLKHESRFSKHFQDMGYLCLVYDDDGNYSSKYPCFINVDEALLNRCPILKRRIFFHDPIMHEAHAIDLPRALQIMRETSDYNEGLIWPNIVRTANLRTLNTTAALTSVHADVRVSTEPRETTPRIAASIHAYYVDMMDELLELTANIPQPHDLIITTDTAEKAKAIRSISGKYSGGGEVYVIVMDQNRGRDMGSLFITCRDFFLSDKYDLVVRLHSKKSPQVDSARSNIFKRHLFENLLNSPGYVENVIDMFDKKPWVGLAVPPAIHISYATLGLGWFANKPAAEELAKELDLRVKLDANSPVAAYGTMFWFRPKALRKLFERKWEWTDFNPEPNHVDGGLAHVLERLISYTAQDAGYTTEQISSPRQAGFNYAMLEFKYSEISANVKAPFHHQVWMMKQWEAGGNALPSQPTDAIRDGYGFRSVWYEDDAITKPVEWPQAHGRLEAFRNKRKGWQHTMDLDGAAKKIGKRYATFDADLKLVCKYLTSAGLANGYNLTQENLREKVGEYLLFGWATGKEIFMLFDSQFYLQKYEDVALSQFNPFVHYIRHGWHEGRQPHPLFDPYHYARQRNVPIPERVDPVLTFVKTPLGEGVSPHPLFDLAHYNACYPEIAAHGQNALSHYIRYGGSERRQPHVLFDQSFYEAGVGAAFPVDINPLVHYLEIGSDEGIDTHALFDRHYYKAAVGDALGGQDPLIHYVTTGSRPGVEPHPLFDSQWYARQNGVERLPGNPLEHYFKHNGASIRSPHPMFDGEAYLDAYPEIRRVGIDPLVHYVKYGAFENRAVPGFNEKLVRPKTFGTSKFVPFVYFLKHFYKANAPVSAKI